MPRVCTICTHPEREAMAAFEFAPVVCVPGGASVEA